MSDVAVTLIPALVARWRRRACVAGGLHGLVPGLPLAALVYLALAGHPARAWAAALVAVVGILVGAGASLRRAGTVGPTEILRHLDRTLPQLQDSADLLLRDPGDLNALQRLQRGRVIERLRDVEEDTLLPAAPLVAAFRWSVAAFAVAALIAWPLSGASVPGAPDGVTGVSAPETETVAAIRAVQVEVVPPDYTGRPSRVVEGLDLEVPQGARLAWRVEPGVRADRVELVFDGEETLPLDQAPDGSHAGTLVATRSRVYHVRTVASGRPAGRSAFARLEVIEDRPPALRGLQPEPLVELAPDDPSALTLELEAEDDYGLTEATLVATLASGSGEMVRFRERRFPIATLRTGVAGPQRLTRDLDLRGLGLEPGSELYFHVEAVDNRRPDPQRGRSPSWLVRMAGDTRDSIALDGGLPIVRLPEYFRSQRQIIMDTERLLEEEPRMTQAEFRRRAEEIGFDQRALRMRYGTILGEQFESGSPLDDLVAEDGGEDADADEVVFDEANALDADPLADNADEVEEDPESELLEGLTHEHDSIENATFFTTSVKQELRAALAAMWDAEGWLRSLAPRDALPHEYVALRHIKAVQQEARIYVLKVGFEPTPLDEPRLRLSGDLTGIDDQRHEVATGRGDELEDLRAAIEGLRRLRQGATVETAKLRLGLDAVTPVLSRRAVDGVAAALEALEQLPRIVADLESGKQPSVEAIDLVTRELWAALPEPAPRPGRDVGGWGTLYDDYRARLSGALQ